MHFGQECRWCPPSYLSNCSAPRKTKKALIHAWLTVSSLISSVIAIASLFVAISGQRKQFAIQIMLQYSERFRLLLNSAPAELLGANAEWDIAEMNSDLAKHVLQILLMLVELHHLRERKYLSGNTWSLWIPDVERMLRSPLMRREWHTRRAEFEHRHSFCRFVDSLQGRRA